MKSVWRIPLSLLSALVGFIITFLIGFYVSFLFGANMHDTTPGIFGLTFGLPGAAFTFQFTNQRLSGPASK